MDISPKKGSFSHSKGSLKKQKTHFFFIDLQTFLPSEFPNVVFLTQFISQHKQQFNILSVNHYEVYLVKGFHSNNFKDFENYCDEHEIKFIDLDQIHEETAEKEDEYYKNIRKKLGVRAKDNLGNLIFLDSTPQTFEIFQRTFPKFNSNMIQISLEKFLSFIDFENFILEKKSTPRNIKKQIKLAYSKKKKLKVSENPADISNMSLSNENLNQAIDPIISIIERIEKNKAEITNMLNSKLESLCAFTSNLEIVCMPYQSKKKRNALHDLNGEDESLLEKILKKPKMNSFLDYNLAVKNNIYLENMLKLNVESAVLNEVSLCEESTISEKESIITTKNDKNVIYCYKSNYPNEKQVCIEISKSDLDRVPDNLLNDNIIWFYLKLIHNELIDEEKRNKTYIFNTYFYQKFFMSLNNMIVNQLSDKDYEKGFNTIKKWTKSIDLFDKDFVFIPIHDDLQKHWCLFVIVYPNLLYKKLMNLEDNYNEKPIDLCAKPMILYFDSFGPLDKNLPIPIRKYLELEFMDKKKEDFAKIQSKWTGIDENMLPCYQPLVLFQDNLKDCGIFVLEYTESFLNNPEFILSNIEENNNKLNWFPRKLIKMKRTHIKNMVLELARGDDMKTVMNKYLKEREEIIKNANEEKDFDHIDMVEFRNYLASINMDINHLKPQEKHEQLIKFYNSKVQASLI